MTPGTKVVTETSAHAESGESSTAVSVLTRTVSYTRWITAACLIVILGSLAFVLANIWIDVFGLYWRKNASTYILDRYSYHLLSERYIPTHFDELFLGSSQSANWDTSLIPGHHIFNLSCGASDLHEQLLLARTTLDSGNIKAVYIFMYPSMMDDVSLPTAYITDKDRLSALGSEQNLLVYAEIIRKLFVNRIEHNPRAARNYYPNGGHDAPVGHRDTRPALPPDFWDLQPVAKADLLNLLAQSRSKGIHVYFVIPAIYAPYYEQYQEKFDAFYQQMAALAGPDVTMIDLLHDPSLQEIRKLHSNYPDLLHPITKVTRAMLEAMARQIDSTSVTGLAGKPQS